MFVINLTKVSKLGDYDPVYFQRYWCFEEDSNTPVSFNSQNQEIESDCSIECEEKTMKKSKKGTTYWQLKKVRVVEQPVNSTTTPEKPAVDPSTHVTQTSTTAFTPKERFTGETQTILELLSVMDSKLDKLLGEDTELDNEASDATARAIDAAKDAHDDGPEMPEDFGLREEDIEV